MKQKNNEKTKIIISPDSCVKILASGSNDTYDIYLGIINSKIPQLWNLYLNTEKKGEYYSIFSFYNQI